MENHTKQVIQEEIFGLILEQELPAIIEREGPEILNDPERLMEAAFLAPLARLGAGALKNVIKKYGKEALKKYGKEALKKLGQKAAETGAKAVAKPGTVGKIARAVKTIAPRVRQAWDRLPSDIKEQIIQTIKDEGYEKATEFLNSKLSRFGITTTTEDLESIMGELTQQQNEGKNIMNPMTKKIILEEMIAVLEEAHCSSAHGRDTAIMPMGGPMASAIAPLPPIGSPVGGCGGGDPHVSKTHKEYDDAYMLKKSLEILANQALALHDAIAGGMILPSWAEAKVYCATDDIKGVHANLDRGRVASGPQAPIIQLAENFPDKDAEDKKDIFDDDAFFDYIERDIRKSDQEEFEKEVQKILDRINSEGYNFNIQFTDVKSEDEKQAFLAGLKSLEEKILNLKTTETPALKESIKQPSDWLLAKPKIKNI